MGNSKNNLRLKIVGILENNNDSRLILATGTTSVSSVDFADNDSAAAGSVSYDHDNDELYLITNGY